MAEEWLSLLVSIAGDRVSWFLWQMKCRVLCFLWHKNTWRLAVYFAEELLSLMVSMAEEYMSKSGAVYGWRKSLEVCLKNG